MDKGFRLFVVATITLLLPPVVWSVTPGPKIQPAISPQDYSEYRYHNHISSDFQDSDRFDLKNPIKLEVTILGIRLDEFGYAELHYTRPGDENIKAPEGSDAHTPIQRYRIATLQTTQQFHSLSLKEKDFERGVAAVLTGWPALPVQSPYSEMLVDEIIVAKNGKTYRFHSENAKMVKFKDKDTPRDQDGESEPDPTTADGKVTDG